MSDLLAPIRNALAAAAEAVAGAAPPAVPLAPPAQGHAGDLASPVAMTLAKATRRPPREIAAGIAEALRAGGGTDGWLAGIEVAGPGFLNITLAPGWFAAAARAVVAAGQRYGAGSAAAPEDILLEFVSANPTGPPHVGHARHAAYGDSLARILEFAGHRVTREFYVNDFGRQMRLFGASVSARYGELAGRATPLPEDGYGGDYLVPIAAAVRDEVGDRYADEAGDPSPEALDLFTARGEELMLEAIRRDLDRFRVRFDRFVSQRELYEAGRVQEGIAALEAAGDAYRDEGAVWFRTSRYGDEKDRVLVRGDGEETYLAADVAYHLDKAARGHDRLLDVLGADHHGYIARLRAVLAAGGHDPDVLEVLIVQLVSLVERGEAKRMSKRAGTLVTLAELVNDIGVERGPLLPRPAQPRDPARPRPRRRARAEPGEPRLLRPVRPRAGSQHPRPGGGSARARGARPATGGASPRRASARPAARRLAGGGRRGAGAARAPPCRRLPHRARTRLPRLLPPLPRGGGGAGARGVPAGRLPGHRRDRPAGARPARRGGARAHVAPRGPWYPERPART